MALNPSDPIVQRVIRRAWAFGKSEYGWQEYDDNEFYQMMKAITISILEEFTGTNALTQILDGSSAPLIIDNTTPPVDGQVPNDDDPGIGPP